MDIEGPEYQIVPLLNSGGIFDQNNITICQMNIEFHASLQHYGMTGEKLNEMIINFTKNSKFTLLNLVFVTHYRTFFLNGHDEYCIRRYLGHFCDSWPNGKPAKESFLHKSPVAL